MSKPRVRLVATGNGYVLVMGKEHIVRARNLLGTFESNPAHKYCGTLLVRRNEPLGWDVHVYPRYVKISMQMVLSKLNSAFDVVLCADDASDEYDDGRKSMEQGEWVRYVESGLGKYL